MTTLCGLGWGQLRVVSFFWVVNPGRSDFARFFFSPQ